MPPIHHFNGCTLEIKPVMAHQGERFKSVTSLQLPPHPTPTLPGTLFFLAFLLSFSSLPLPSLSSPPHSCPGVPSSSLWSSLCSPAARGPGCTSGDRCLQPRGSCSHGPASASISVPSPGCQGGAGTAPLGQWVSPALLFLQGNGRELGTGTILPHFPLPSSFPSLSFPPPLLHIYSSPAPCYASRRRLMAPSPCPDSHLPHLSKGCLCTIPRTTASPGQCQGSGHLLRGQQGTAVPWAGLPGDRGPDHQGCHTPRGSC